MFVHIIKNLVFAHAYEIGWQERIGVMADCEVKVGSFERSKSTIYSAYVRNLDVTARKRYETKLLYNYGTQSLPDPYNLSDGWSDDPSTWPDLTFGDIYTYLIDTPSIFTKESMKAYKSLDAYKYVVSGHVQVVMSQPILDSPYIAMKTKVAPSQRARDKPHEVWVYLEKDTGTVYCAHCNCMAGLGEVCSHVAALLFKVEIAVKTGLTEKSSTSKACQWNSTFRKEVKPADLHQIYGQIKGKRTKDIPIIQADGSAPLPPSKDLQSLFELMPNAAFFTAITLPSSASSEEPAIDVNSSVEGKFPRLLSTFQDSADLVEDIFNTYTCSQRQSDALEQITRDQSVSPLWYQHRVGRVTSTSAHDVHTRKTSTPPDKLIKKICGYDSYDLSKRAAVKWGVEHEDECRELYINHQKTVHTDFDCRQSGFLINPLHPFLGASADGICSCACCGRGTLEIKCPHKHKDVSVQQAADSDNTFCLDTSLTLKKGHRYYTQVQYQMTINNVNMCDFVVFTNISVVIVRVPVDITFCNALMGKCEHFVKTFVIKELITHVLENQQQSPQETAILPSENQTTWCICSEPEYGRMVKCDNDECPYQWFHYKCVNIRRKPKGHWYCYSCDN